MSPRRLLVPGLALGLVLGLTGCGAGLRAQTYQERTQAEATNESIGELAIRNLRVLAPEGEGSAVYEAGEDAQALLTVVNEGAESDRLVDVSSPLASSVEVIGPEGEGAELVVEGQSSTSAFGFVLRGLESTVRTGEFVEMQLTFERNGTETMLVPVALTGIPGEKREGYHVAPLDSAGNVLVEEEEGEGGEGEAP